MTKPVSGLIYEYYFICPRKAWLSSHGISMESENDNVQIGKMIDEASYSREEKHIQISENACLDFMRNGMVYEIKKSSKEKAASISQIQYYLYILHQKGLPVSSGELRIPEEKYTEKITMTEDDYLTVEKKINEIQHLIDESIPPAAIKTRKCGLCAFFELCFI